MPASPPAPSDSPPFTLESRDGQRTLQLTGAWRLTGLERIEAALAAHDLQEPLTIDGSGLLEFDTAAALVLLRALRPVGATAAAAAAAAATDARMAGFNAVHARLLAQVAAHLQAQAAVPPPPARRLLGRLGLATVELGELLAGHLNFLGATLAAAAGVLRRPGRLRVRELVVQLEQCGLSALPVVVLVTMLIGVVFTYLLGLQSEKYGANIFVVDGVGIGMSRELAPIIVAVIIAGRSGASFTAQLGSMRLTEEIDAIRTMGLSPQLVLVLPRVLALMLMLPLLVFAGDAASLLGSLLIAGPMLDIAPVAFVARLREALDLRHVLVGLAKAPVFALFIALIGARMGMTVGRDTRAVGAATTSTVVQGIVAVIVLDAAFAVLLQALDW